MNYLDQKWFPKPSDISSGSVVLHKAVIELTYCLTNLIEKYYRSVYLLDVGAQWQVHINL